MTLQEIHAQLRAKFGDAVADFVPPESGEAWIELKPEGWGEAARFLRDDAALKFDFLRCVSAVDYTEWMESVYHLFSYAHEHEATIKVKVTREKPGVPSVAGVWPSADWHEREAYDMLGIEYEGHPDLRRILLPEDWEGFPLRKDYKQPEEYHGISNW